MYFLLWTKWSHEYQFWHFQVFWWKFAKFIIIFQTTSVFLEILHDSSASWKMTPLYFFGQMLCTLHKRDQSKCKFLRLLSGRIKINQILVIFETTNQFFFQILHHSSVSWDVTPLYFFSWNFICFQQKSIKLQIRWNFTRAVESLKFCTLMDLVKII